jgi:hypothetical protein
VFFRSFSKVYKIMAALLENMTKVGVLINQIEKVLCTSLSTDIQQKIIEEELSEETFVLLNEENLKELGFKMAPRKLLLSWIDGKKLPKSLTQTCQLQAVYSTPTPTTNIIPANDQPSTSAATLMSTQSVGDTVVSNNTFFLAYFDKHLSFLKLQTIKQNYRFAYRFLLKP